MLRVSELGIWQFFFLTIIAMAVFPGGTIFNSELKTYSFLNNFFSDMGRSVDFRGESNPSRWVFSLTLTLVAVGMACFFLAIPKIFKDQFKVAKKAVLLFGLITAICYVGIGFTPWDIVLKLHESFVKIGFTAFLIMSLFMTFMIYKKEVYPNFYGHIYMLFNILLLSYILLIFFGPDPRADIRSLTIQVIGQKIIVYSEIICMLIQIRGARKVLNLVH